MNPRKRICVFCGSRKGARPAYAEAAIALGQLLAQRGRKLVYGGGNIGLMGILADAVLAAKGEVFGVIPVALEGLEVAHLGLTETHVVGSMHERKALMEENADAFVALPGGFGTFEELCEMLTWSQLGIHSKPIGVLNVAGYFDPFLQFFNHAVDEKFLQPRHRDLLIVETDPGLLIDRLDAFVPDPEPKILEPEES